MMSRQVVLIRHGESRNNVLYDEIRAEFGQDVSPQVLENEEGKRRRSDPGLSDRGMEQAKCLGAFFQARGGFDGALNPLGFNEKTPPSTWQLYSSPMQRALLTSSEMLKAMGSTEVAVGVHPELYESGGCHEHGCGLPGSSKSDVEERFPGFVCEPGMEQGWFHGRSKEETTEEFMARMDRLAAWVCAQRHNLVLVVHGNLMSGLLNRLVLGSEGNSSGNMGGLYMHYNTAFSHLQLFDEALSLSLSLPDAPPQERVPIVAIQGINRIDHLVDNVALLSGNRVHDDHWVQEYTPLLRVWRGARQDAHQQQG